MYFCFLWFSCISFSTLLDVLFLMIKMILYFCIWWLFIFLPVIQVHQVGNGGVGYIWSVSEYGLDDDWKHSVAPIPADKLVGITQTLTDELDVPTLDGNILPPSGELEPDSVTNDSIDDAEDIRDESVFFEKEVGICKSTEKKCVSEIILNVLFLYAG